MPAIRDISWTFESTTTDGGIIVPMPAYEDGDLLLAFIQSDTGVPAITATNWQQIFTRTNTCSLTVLQKIATGSAEPATVTFSSAVTETYNGAIVSVENVDIHTPINVSNDTTQVSAAKYAFQAVTTTKDNCLIMCAGANASAGVPSMIEGPVIGLLGADGAAESQGIGWTYMPRSGSSDKITTSISCSNAVAGVGVKAVIAINPPVSGTLVVPTYCASDTSKYIDPIHGTTAYNGNAAYVATADTLFGTSLNGVTVGDPTVAAAADVGLNSFHSTGQSTTVTSTANWGGTTIDLAAGNVINVTGKNVIVHCGPSTAGQIQRFPTVAANKKGIAFGMLSTAGNYKVWYVHGAGTPWGQSRDVPLVINSSAVTGTVLQSAGSFNPAAVDVFGFWVSSTGVSTTAWQFYSLWMLDTTVVAGGNVSGAVNISGIVNATAAGHERRSVIQQGSNQALVLQPIQFGDGAVNPIYLDLNATAIEFPRQYSLSDKQINYCSADNVAGLTYYGGSGDTIKHRNSVVSSPSPYHWRLHPSSSVSATYDFSGLSIIGAGDVQLHAAPVFQNVSFTNCGKIVQNTARLDSCNINSATASAALQSNAPASMSNCTFTSAGTGHGIEFMVTGTYTFTGNAFVGYAVSDGNTGNEAVYNNSSGSLTLNVVGGGSVPSVRNGTSATTTVNSNVSITLTGLKNPSEVRVFSAGTQTELAGQENVTTGTFVFSVGSGVSVDISILSLGYQNQRILAYSTAVDASIPVSQQLDRQYANP